MSFKRDFCGQNPASVAEFYRPGGGGSKSSKIPYNYCNFSRICSPAPPTPQTFLRHTAWKGLCRVLFPSVWNVIFVCFGFALLRPVIDWQKLAPLFQPTMRSKTKTNRDLHARIFPRLAPASCTCFVVWLVHRIVYVCSDWFWFYDTQFKRSFK